MEEVILQEKLEQFQCARCNECCRKPGYVYLEKDEPESMAAFLRINAFEFVNLYCDLLDRRELVLKKNPDESCVFLTSKGCLVHPAKPRQCREFPVRWRTAASLDYCEGIKNLFPEGMP